MREIALFVSSTFSDMHDERELLLREVFPRVQEFCRKHNLIFRPIDLRWGITKEQADELNQTVDLCLQRVNQAAPLFLSFLGQRYGWIPGNMYLQNHRYDHPEALAQYEGRSVTEMEIMQALFSSFYAGEPKECLFFFKDPSYLEGLTEEERRIYADPPQQTRALDALKDFLVDRGCDVSVYSSRFQWVDIPVYLEQSGDVQSKRKIQTDFTCDGGSLAAVLVKKIIAAIRRCVDLSAEEPAAYDGQMSQEYQLNFYSHTAPVATVDDYLEKGLGIERGGMWGLGMVEAQGKSSAMARFVTKLQTKNDWVFYRFLGTDVYSSSVREVVKTLSREMSVRMEIPFDGYDDYFAAFDFLQDCLNRLYERGEDVIFVVDGLNQSSDTQVRWYELFHSVAFGHVFYSTTEMDEGVALTGIPRFSDEEIQAIIDFHFLQYGRTVDRRCCEKLIARAQGQLVHILHIVRYISRFSSFESLEGDIEKMVGCHHLDGMVMLDDMYSRAQPMCSYWERSVAMKGLLSMITYTVMLCRKGISYAELLTLLYSVMNCTAPAKFTVDELEDCLRFELNLLEKELHEVDGIYTIQDPFYADMLINELNFRRENRKAHFEHVIRFFSVIYLGKYSCFRHFEIVNDLLHNCLQEDLEGLLEAYYLTPEYLGRQIEVCGFSYTLKHLRYYYVKTLGYQHLLSDDADHEDASIQRFLDHTPTSVLNHIGLLYRLLERVPYRFQKDMDRVYACLHRGIAVRNLQDTVKGGILKKLWEEIRKHEPRRSTVQDGTVCLYERCQPAPHKMLLHGKRLYTFGRDDRIYVHNLETGECSDLIQMQKGDRGVCMFYAKPYVYFVGERLIYVHDPVSFCKVPYDYVKYTGAPLRGVDVFDGEIIAFWYEDGFIKVYKNMQPLFEISEFLGSKIGSVLMAYAGERLVAYVAVEDDGCYMAVNGYCSGDLWIHAEEEYRSGRFCSRDGNAVYMALGENRYQVTDLSKRDNEIKETSYPILNRFSVAASIQMTETEDGFVVMNGTRLPYRSPCVFVGIIHQSDYCFVDAEGMLFSV